LPRFVTFVALLLGALYLASCVITPPGAGDQVLLGHRFVGSSGWLASAAHGVFFLWLAYASWRRRSVAVSGQIGYCVYMIENIWIYSIGEGREYFRGFYSMLLVNAVVTAVLLAICRIILQRRAVFDR